MEDLIIKSNRLIKGREEKPLTAIEQRIILHCSMLITEDNFDSEQIIKIQELFNTDAVSTRQYTAFRKACKQLVRTAIALEEFENGEWTYGDYSPIFKNIKVTPKKGTATFRFNEFVKEHIIGLRSNFTTYAYQNVQHLDSGFSIRIYELLMQGKNKYRSRVFNVDNLLNILAVNEMKTYKVFTKIRKNILDKACDEITQKTDINCTWEVTDKVGRKITEIMFVWDYKQQIVLEAAISKENKQKITKKPAPSNRKARLVVVFDDYLLNRKYYAQKEEEFDVQIENEDGDLVPRLLFDQQILNAELVEEKTKKENKTISLDLEGKKEEVQDKMKRLLQRLTEDFKLTKQQAIPLVNHTEANAVTGVWKFINQTKLKIKDGEVKKPQAYVLKCIETYYQTGAFE